LSKIKELKTLFFTDEQREKQIKKEKKKLVDISKGLTPYKKILCDTLIENIAFCVVQLEELRELIKANGYIEQYKNGENQYGYKESTLNKQYISTGKIYATYLSKLKDFIAETDNGGDSLDDYDKSH
jgi:hypothetical protein